MGFSERLLSLRKQTGLSQEELGNMVGVSRQTVSKWETGVTTPELDKLMALGDYFSVSLDELVGREAAEDYANMPQYDTEPMQPREWVRRWRFEYRSKREIHGLPLVHIHFGDRGICHAKGIVAIGNVATGVVALGTVAVGVISLGAVSAGLLALGAVALGTVTLGGLAVGLLALGGLAVGYLAIGGCAIGIYTVGAAAIGARVAVGEAVKAPLALGREKVGDIPSLVDNLESMIQLRFPKTPHWIAELLAFLARHL